MYVQSLQKRFWIEDICLQLVINKAGIYLFKVNDGNNRKMCERKLTIN